jgi:hypothetical protein
MAMRLELHPLCALFPRMEGQEFEDMKADIRVHGLRQRIVVYNGMILDGGNRHRACLDIGVPPVTMDYNGNDPVGFVLSQNLHRRHMSVGQRAMAVAATADWAKAHKHGGDRKSDQAVTITARLQTVADRAAESGASDKTQRAADKVARADPKLAGKVSRGEISLPQAVRKINGHAIKKKPQPEPEVIEGMPTAGELLDEINAENKLLQERVDAMNVTEHGKKIDELVRMNEYYRREKDAEMDRNARLLRERDALSRWQGQVVRLTGSKDPKAALEWIKLAARQTA